MADARKEYIKAVRDFIHGPRFDGYPIYGKVNPEERANAQESAMLSDQKWVTYTKTENTSPNNIRAVVIGVTDIYVVHYNAISKNIGLIRHGRLPALTSPLGADEVRSMLASFSSPWVCANIEEVLVETILYRGTNNAADITDRPVEDADAKALAQTMFAANAYKNSAGATTQQDFLARFPRLRAVSAIQSADPKAFTVRREMIQQSKEGTEKFRDANIGLFHAFRSIQKTATYTFRSTPSAEYSLRKGDYIFDNKLSAVTALAEAVQDKNLADRTQELQNKFNGGGAATKPTLEEYLDALEKKDPKVIRLAFVNLDTESQIDVLNEFTAPGKAKYKRILGLDEG